MHCHGLLGGCSHAESKPSSVSLQAGACQKNWDCGAGFSNCGGAGVTINLNDKQCGSAGGCELGELHRQRHRLAQSQSARM